jgi:hypothetical protein
MSGRINACLVRNRHLSATSLYHDFSQANRYANWRVCKFRHKGYPLVLTLLMSALSPQRAKSKSARSMVEFSHRCCFAKDGGEKPPSGLNH